MSEALVGEMVEMLAKQHEVAIQQVQSLRKALNDVLKAASITGQDDLAAPLLCQMASRYIEFLARGDAAMDARFKPPAQYWYVEASISSPGMFQPTINERFVLDQHPLLWLESVRAARKIDLLSHLRSMTEIPSSVYDSLKNHWRDRDHWWCSVSDCFRCLFPR